MRYTPETLFRVAFRLCIPVLIIGFMFKIMHWPAASVLIVSALLLMILFSVLRFSVQKKRNILDYIRVALTASFAIRGILVILHWPGVFILSIIFLVSLILWIWFDGFGSFLNPGKDTEITTRQKLSNTFLIIGGIFTISGILMKMMHWPGAGIMLIIGIGMVAVSFFSGVIKE